MIETGSEVMLIGLLLFIVLFFFSIYIYFSFYIPFKRRRDYIKVEIARTRGAVNIYWKKELKKFYIESIPLIGKAIWKIIR